jgi:hypothetical protein
MSASLAVMDVPFAEAADFGPVRTIMRQTGRGLLSSCERDILGVMGDGAQRMTTRKIQTALRREGYNRSLSSLKRALASLVSKGILRSNRRKPFGYLRAGDVPDEPIIITEVDVLDVLREVGFRMTRHVLATALWERGTYWTDAKLAEELDRLLLEGVIDYNPDIRPAGYGLRGWR